MKRSRNSTSTNWGWRTSLSEETVARVYARALFDAARDARVIDPVGRDLGDFVAALREAYEALVATEADLVKVEMTSAVELTAAARKKIAARVAEAAGRQVELAPRVDPDIIGGLVLRVGDVIVDGSVQALSLIHI